MNVLSKRVRHGVRAAATSRRRVGAVPAAVVASTAVLVAASPSQAQQSPGSHMGGAVDPSQHRPMDMTVTSQSGGDASAKSQMQMSGMRMNPAPAGVLAGQMPPSGGLVLSYSALRIVNGKLLSGTNTISPEEAVLTVPNPNQPPVQLRRVPMSNTVLVQGFAVNYGVTPWLSVGAATTYLNKSTDTVTFAGTSGIRRLGTSQDSTNGLGDSRIGVQVRLWRNETNVVHVAFGVGLPTGSITQIIHPLQPNGQTGTSRAGYTLQLGTGTFDALPAVTWLGQYGDVGMGAAYRGRMSMQGRNAEGYRWGNVNLLTAWVSYRFMPLLSGSFRVQGLAAGAISGRDPKITGPGLGANPANIGGDRIDAFVGMQLANLPAGIGAGGINLELGVPLYQKANGAHLGGTWSLQLSGTLRF
ncbi:MAG: hypothetical protein AB7O80_13620 [Acetobacteraceae bacterium]